MPGTWRAIIAGGEIKPAGERTLLVTIQRPVAGQGASGFPVQTWEDLLPIEYMWRIHVQSDERWAAAQISAYRVFLWQMRYRADMNPDLINMQRDRRLLYMGKIYDIRSANVLGSDGLGNACIEIATLSQD